MPRILLGITGSVAAVRSPRLFQGLRELGHSVRAVATEPALYFFDPDELVADEPALFRDRDEWPGSTYHRDDPVLHIVLRDWADVLCVAPLDANTLAKFSLGLADNLLTCLFRAWDFSKPIVLAPAMNTRMWESPVTLRHLRQLLDDRGDGLHPSRFSLVEAPALFAPRPSAGVGSPSRKTPRLRRLRRRRARRSRSHRRRSRSPRAMITSIACVPSFVACSVFSISFENRKPRPGERLSSRVSKRTDEGRRHGCRPRRFGVDEEVKEINCEQARADRADDLWFLDLSFFCGSKDRTQTDAGGSKCRAAAENASGSRDDPYAGFQAEGRSAVASASRRGTERSRTGRT